MCKEEIIIIHEIITHITTYQSKYISKFYQITYNPKYSKSNSTQYDGGKVHLTIYKLDDRRTFYASAFCKISFTARVVSSKAPQEFAISRNRRFQMLPYKLTVPYCKKTCILFFMFYFSGVFILSSKVIPGE